MNSNNNLPEKKPRDDPGGSKPPAKRLRRGGGARSDERAGIASPRDGAARAAAALPSDALSVAMSFLHPRDLLSAAFSCRSLRDAVDTRMVVRSAMLHGGHSKKTMEELHALTSSHSVRVPSPLRLLRLACGRVCEFCLSGKVNHVRPTLGVFGCWDCVTRRSPRDGEFGLTRPWSKRWVRYGNNQEKYDAILEHPRISATAKAYGTDLYVWSEHRSDLAGETVGPIVAWEDVDRMANHFGSASDMTNGGIDDYLVDDLDAPSIESYGDFNDAFTDMQQRAEAAVREREESKRARSRKAKENKVAKVEKMLVDLTALIDEPFRDLALKREKNTSFHYASATVSRTPCVYIQTPFISGLLEPYIITPSKIKKKTLKEMAESINTKLRMITDEGLLEMTFLSDSAPFDVALKQYLREKLPGLKALFEGVCALNNRKISSNKMDETFFSILEAGRAMAAVAHLMNNNFSPVLLATNPSAAVARSSGHEDQTLRKVARHCWYECLGEEDGDSDARYVKAFVASQEVFREALEALEEYSKWMQKKQVTEDKRTHRLKEAAESPMFLELVMEKDFDKVSRRQARDWEWRMNL